MPDQPHLQIFVLIDALGWTYLQDRQFLPGILRHRQPLRTVLGFSSGAIPTILTGQPPARTGHWNLLYYDPQGSPFRWLRCFHFLPDALLDNRYTRKILKELGRRLLGMGPLFECCVSPRFLPLFNWVEKRNIFAPGGIRQVPSIFDRLAAAGVHYRAYSYHTRSDEEILAQAARDVGSNQAQVFFLYLCEFDAFLHAHCKDPRQIDLRLASYEAALRELLMAARRVDSQAELTVFSDHGMTPVENSFDLAVGVTALGLRQPQDYLAVYDSTMVRFWFFSDTARQSITSYLRAVECGRLLPESELRDLGVFFEDHRYGEIVFLMRPGWLIAKSDFNGPGWSPAGMHGFHPDDRYSDGVFLASRVPAQPVHTVADVHTCLERALTDEDRPLTLATPIEAPTVGDGLQGSEAPR